MGCIHCSTDSEVIFFSEELGYVFIVETDQFSEEYQQNIKVAVEIEYCPFCGRKLKYINNF